MGRFMAAVLTLGWLAVAHPLAQTKPKLAGKWTFDTEKTAAANPGGGGIPLPDGRDLIVNHDAKTLTVMQPSPVGDPRTVYSLVGAETTVPVGQTNGRPKATWEGNRLVVTITVQGRWTSSISATSPARRPSRQAAESAA
jgi:hypothetical protein